MATLWDYRYAQRTQRMRASVIRELLKLTEQPDIISFGGGLPAADLFPVAEVAAATQRVLATQGGRALQYGATEGYTPLRELIVRHTARYGLHITPDNVLITSGSQQALDLLGKVFINPGDRIVVEAPTYLGALQAWNAYGAEYVPVPVDAHGMCIAALEEALQSSPKFIYVLPNFQNPSGVTLTLSRRRHLLALAARYGVPIVEDDPYGQLRFEGEHLPPVVVIDGRRGGPGAFCYEGNVIYLSTFSKILAPGLRLAWVVAPPEVIGKLVQAKQGTDLHTATFTQMIATEVAQGGFLDRHVRQVRAVYRERRNVMLRALEEHFPPQVQWTHPAGGLFLWCTLPAGLDATELLPGALAAGVAFVPGTAFFAGGGGENTLRLNFSSAPPEQIREGIARLGRVLHEALPPAMDTPALAAQYAAVG